MTTVELRNNFHRLIDSIDNKNLLMKFYDLLLKNQNQSEGKLLQYLTNEELEELLLVEEESSNPDNVVSNEDQKKKHNKWLSK